MKARRLVRKMNWLKSQKGERQCLQCFDKPLDVWWMKNLFLDSYFKTSVVSAA
jgi:hypothetical protein